MNIEQFSKLLLNKISKNKSEIINLLCKVEDLETAQYEVEHSIYTLERLSVQEQFLQRESFKRLAVFMPINLPLYSLVLYAVIPGYMFNEVYIKCNSSINPLLVSMIKFLGLADSEINYKVVDVNREVFLEGYASASDVIIFTGKYKNVTDVIMRLPKKVIIYYGYGINPIIIMDKKNLKSVVDIVVSDRMFNSGRDCIAPDCIFVRENICDEFLDLLVNKLKLVKDGVDNEAQGALRSTHEEKHLQKLSQYITRNKDSVFWGLQPNPDRSTVSPLVLKRDINKVDIFEFFSPIFNIFSFKNKSEVVKLLQTKEFDENTMYTIVFSSKQIDKKIQPNHLVLLNTSIESVDDGNKEFGGYGKKVNFVYNCGSYIYRPILISKELYNIVHARSTQETRSKYSRT